MYFYRLVNVKTISGIVKKVQSGIHAFPGCTEFRYFLKFASLFFNQEQNLPEMIFIYADLL